MATSFASRLNNMREKKTSNEQDNLKLILPSDTNEKSSYEPSSSSGNSRPSLRLLKGRIERTGSQDTKEGETGEQLGSKIAGLKLVINDNPIFEEKKPLVVEQPAKVQPQKRILIAKESPQEQSRNVEPKVEEAQKKREVQPQKPIKAEEPQRLLNTHDEKAIREEDLEESGLQNENQLLTCPEGCGRKFNKKALEKHAKACKLVFMSKRKEFNSEAKRITSKEQAVIVKQSKIKQKKQLGATRGKFDKTGDNWKAASEDFRSAIKAMKEDPVERDQEEPTEEVAVKVCEYCEKQFNEHFLAKHLENCPRRKEKEREKDKRRSIKK